MRDVIVANKLEDVFNEATHPRVTFVPPQEFKFLLSSLRAPGKHVTLSGPSGCGKTTLVEYALEDPSLRGRKCLKLSGRDYPEAQEWQDFFSEALECAKEKGAILEALQRYDLVVIDDYHHLPLPVRSRFASLLKRWSELGIRLLIIGIGKDTSTLVESDSELSIRCDSYKMSTQPDWFIEQVVFRGEKALNIAFEKDARADFIRAANGIPSAIQAICRIACVAKGIRQSSPSIGRPYTVTASLEEIRGGVLRLYNARYLAKVQGLAKGKQQARSVHDTYFDIVSSICELNTSEILVEHIRARALRGIVDRKQRARKATSFQNCLRNLQDVLDARKLNDAIVYKPDIGVISIEDPALRLFLSLLDPATIRSKINVRQTDFPWDVAISFESEQRPLAEELRNMLTEMGYIVFYDRDYQHALWGKDLQLVLADIYAQQAEYMVVILSKEYPEKDWPRFEMAVGRQARGKRTKEYILPVIVDDVTIVGLDSTVGFIDLRECSSADAALALSEKIEGGREWFVA